MINKYFKNAISLFWVVASLITITACQPTPEKPIIISKNDNLEEKILSEEMESSFDNLDEKWCFEKEYDEGKKLRINASVFNNNTSNIPVVSIAENPYSGNIGLIKKIIGYFCDESFELLEGVNEPTKADIQKEIIRMKQALQEAKQEGDPEDVITTYENTVKELERQFKEAPAASEATKTDYKLKEADDGSYQLNIVATQNGESKYEIDFVDWINTKGSLLLIQDKKTDNYSSEYTFKYVPQDYLESDENFQNGKKIIDSYLSEIGLDYLNLNLVSGNIEENTYEYYFTRSVNGLNEGYVNSYFGSMQSDEDIMMDLWYAESMLVRVTDGKITYIKWDNPSLVTGVDNDNVRIISFEEAKEAFLKQIGYMLAPNIDDEIGKANYEFFKANTAINITRIELSLTKLLMKDSDDSYKLIPTWNFYGYESLSSHKFDENRGAEICYVAVNALDGSIVNYTALN